MLFGRRVTRRLRRITARLMANAVAVRIAIGAPNPPYGSAGAIAKRIAPPPPKVVACDRRRSYGGDPRASMTKWEFIPRAFLAAILAIAGPVCAPAQQPELKIFDAHLHYNDDALPILSVGEVLD